MNVRHYRPEIDGLRALAVSAVVLFHAGFGPISGYQGVDIFFVISGFLITGTLLAERQDTGTISLLAFYQRRMLRLVPALLIVVAVVSMLSLAFLSRNGEQWQFAKSAAASLAFAGNIYFELTSGGYFEPATDGLPLLHLWSLGVEEQFYLVWPWMLGLGVLARRESFIKSLLIIALLSLAFSEVALYYSPELAFFQMPTRFWEFAGGCGVSIMRPLAPRYTKPLAYLGFGLTAISLFIANTHFPGVGALPVVLGSALLLAAIGSSGDMGLVGTLLRMRPVVFIGLISYSLYLWHWPLFALLHATSATAPSVAMQATLCGVAVALSVASFRYIEHPFRALKRYKARPVIACAIGSLVIVATAVLAVTWWGNHGAVPTDKGTLAANDVPYTLRRCHLKGGQANETALDAECVSDARLPIRIAIWGDSHALAWQPFAWELAKEMHVSALELSRDNCAPALGFENGAPSAESVRCLEFNKRALSRLKGFDTVIVTSKWPVRYDRPSFEMQFAKTIGMLAGNVRRVILLGPTPLLPAAAPLCMSRNELGSCVLSRSAYDERTRSSREALLRLTQTYPNVQYISLDNFFCNEKICGPTKDGYGLYWDNNHITVTAATAFTKTYLKNINPSK